MKIAIIASSKDEAGMNIKQCLLDLFGFSKVNREFDGETVYELGNIKLYTAGKVSVDCDHVKNIDADMIVFATKHASASGINSLSVHTQGNWTKAELGGKDRQLCVCPALYLKAAMIALEKNAPAMNYEIIQECTHHGPYLTKPCFFIEIGSSIEEWKNRAAGEVIAKTIIEVLQHEPPKARACLGIGGPHHTPNFKKIILKTNIAIGHTCPKYNLQNLDKEMILQAVEKTLPRVELIAVDWKGLGQEKQKIIGILDDIKSELGIEWKKTKELKN